MTNVGRKRRRNLVIQSFLEEIAKGLSISGFLLFRKFPRGYLDFDKRRKEKKEKKKFGNSKPQQFLEDI